MSKSKTTPLRVIQVVVHGQGSTNAEFEILRNDGSVDEYYSIDGDFPKHKTTDQPIAKERESFGKTLMELWGIASFEKDPDDEDFRIRENSLDSITRESSRNTEISLEECTTTFSKSLPKSKTTDLLF